MATHLSILAWRTPWKEEPGGLQSIGSQNQTELTHLSMHARQECQIAADRVMLVTHILSLSTIRSILFMILLKDRHVLTDLRKLLPPCPHPRTSEQTHTWYACVRAKSL